eukprot:gene6712-5008_t
MMRDSIERPAARRRAGGTDAGGSSSINSIKMGRGGRARRLAAGAAGV